MDGIGRFFVDDAGAENIKLDIFKTAAKRFAYCPVTPEMKAEAYSVPIWKVKALPEVNFT